MGGVLGQTTFDFLLGRERINIFKCQVIQIISSRGRCIDEVSLYKKKLNILVFFIVLFSLEAILNIGIYITIFLNMAQTCPF